MHETYGTGCRAPRRAVPSPFPGQGLDGAAALYALTRPRGYRVVRTDDNGGRDHACRQGPLADALVETFR
ncbi:hypothetical protein RB201_16545 [Streptomyces sp. S1A(2023)]